MNPERICYGCFQDKEPGLICPHCGFDQQEEQPYLALPLGTLLNGRYMLGKVLGIGGFGITYLGYDLTLEIKVAVKEYMPSSVATRHADRYSVTLTGRVEAEYQYGMERFLEEAKILAKLQNTPNIVSVQNYFKENNTAYFVMDYIDGMSLKAYLKSQGKKYPLPRHLPFFSRSWRHWCRCMDSTSSIGTSARTIFISPPGAKAGCWILAPQGPRWEMEKACRSF